jgi:hypothetical protein
MRSRVRMRVGVRLRLRAGLPWRASDRPGIGVEDAAFGDSGLRV